MGWLKSRKADWQRFRDLDGEEKRLLAALMLVLPATVVAHRLLGLGRVQVLLARVLPRNPEAARAPGENMRIARSLSRLLRIAANRGPASATCLQQSIVLQRLLVRQGIDADLRIGVRRQGGALDAHAWVEYLGQVLNGQRDARAHFTCFPGRISTELSGEP